MPSEGIMKGFLQGCQTVDATTCSLLPSQLVGICRAMCVCAWSLLGMSNLIGLGKVIEIFLSLILVCPVQVRFELLGKQGMCIISTAAVLYSMNRVHWFECLLP